MYIPTRMKTFVVYRKRRRAMLIKRRSLSVWTMVF